MLRITPSVMLEKIERVLDRMDLRFRRGDLRVLCAPSELRHHHSGEHAEDHQHEKQFDERESRSRYVTFARHSQTPCIQIKVHVFHLMSSCRLKIGSNMPITTVPMIPAIKKSMIGSAMATSIRNWRSKSAS